MRLLTISWLVLLSMAMGLRAQTTNGTNISAWAISLEQCIEFALKHNLDVQLSRIEPEISRYKLSIDYASWDPALFASGTHSFSATPGGVDQRGTFPATETKTDTFNAGVGPGGGVEGLLPSGLTYNLSGTASDRVSSRFPETSGSTVGLTLRQPLLKNFWIDRTRLNIKLDRKDLKEKEMDLQLQIMTVINNVAQAYYELIFARQNIQVQQAALDLAERLVAENRKRVQVGTLAPLDEKQAESQAAASKADLLIAQNASTTQENVLKGLMTDSYTTLHATELVPTEVLAAPIPLLSLRDSWAKAMTQRPDLAKSRLEVEKQNIQLRYDYNQLFPQLDLIGSYGFAGSGKEYSDAFGGIRAGNSPNYSYGASITFPLGNRAARGTYANSKEQKKKFLLNLKSLEQGILIQIDNAVKQVRNGFERVDASRQARVYAETALDAEQKKLESGKSTSFNVLQFQRDLTARRSDEIRALADFNKALSQLYFLEGSSLERNHVAVEVK